MQKCTLSVENHHFSLFINILWASSWRRNTLGLARNQAKVITNDQYSIHFWWFVIAKRYKSLCFKMLINVFIKWSKNTSAKEEQVKQIMLILFSMDGHSCTQRTCTHTHTLINYIYLLSQKVRETKQNDEELHLLHLLIWFLTWFDTSNMCKYQKCLVRFLLQIYLFDMLSRSDSKVLLGHFFLLLTVSLMKHSFFLNFFFYYSKCDEEELLQQLTFCIACYNFFVDMTCNICFAYSLSDMCHAM